MSAAVYYPEETKNHLPSLVEIMLPNDGIIANNHSLINLGLGHQGGVGGLVGNHINHIANNSNNHLHHSLLNNHLALILNLNNSNNLHNHNPILNSNPSTNSNSNSSSSSNSNSNSNSTANNNSTTTAVNQVAANPSTGISIPSTVVTGINGGTAGSGSAVITSRSSLSGGSVTDNNTNNNSPHSLVNSSTLQPLAGMKYEAGVGIQHHIPLHVQQQPQVPLQQQPNASPFQYRGPDRCTCKNNQNRIPRPRNAFILFRQKYHQSVLDEGTVCRTNPEVLRELGKRWRLLSQQEKEYWNNLAEEEKVSHAKKYPGYRYTPRRNGKNKSCDFCRLKQIRQQPRSQLYDYLMLLQLQMLRSPLTHLSGHLLFLGQLLLALYGTSAAVQGQVPVQMQFSQAATSMGHNGQPPPHQPQHQFAHLGPQPIGMGMPQFATQQLGLPMVAGNNLNLSNNSNISGSNNTPVLTATSIPQSQNGQLVPPYVQYVPFQQPNIPISYGGANDGSLQYTGVNGVPDQKLLPLSAPTSEFVDQRYYVPTMDANYQI